MSVADIWQIVIGIVSIIASVTLSLIIFYYQVKTDKKVKNQDIENKVTNFIIGNKDEMSLLPLCIISNCLHKTDKHSRKIYTAFNKLDKSVQSKILEHENIDKLSEVTELQVDNLISYFEEIEKRYSMGISMLYDGAKYFHRAYEFYKNDKIEDIDPYVFQKPYPTFLPENKTSLNTYIDNYLFHIVDPNNDLLTKVQKKYFEPPMDLLYTGFDLGNCEEKTVCFWLMRYIISTSYVLCNRDLVKPIDDDKMPILEEFNLETYEDMYYYTLYMLIKTFSKSI